MNFALALASLIFVPDSVAVHDGNIINNTRKANLRAHRRETNVFNAPGENNGRDPQQVADDHLAANANSMGLTKADVAGKRVVKKYKTKHNGVVHMYYNQAYQGIEVANGNINVNVKESTGKLVGKVGNSFVRDLENKAGGMRNPKNTAEDAIACAIHHLGLDEPNTPTDKRRLQPDVHLPPKVIRRLAGPSQETTFDGAGFSQGDIKAKLVFYRLPDEAQGVDLAWELEMNTLNQQFWGNIWINARLPSTCEVIDKSNWISGAADTSSYEVFGVPMESPLSGNRAMATNPATDSNPNGWHNVNGVEYTTTRGNNVCAQTDTNGSNSACGTGGIVDGGSSHVFSTLLDLSTQSPDQYQDAAVVNLFYWNNVLHDILYEYGFDEASGNFQEDNYGKGGLGSDSVNADAQDGSGTNNANFATPPDGSNPRMQMFVWASPFTHAVTVDSPSNIAASYAATDASFGPTLGQGRYKNGVSGTFVMAGNADGCTSLTNAEEISGNIAVIDRGDCTFVEKVTNAQNAGATAVIVVNNVEGSPIAMGGSGSTSIPSTMISKADGDKIKDQLSTGVSGLLNKVSSSTSVPDRDSDFDNGIIAHEYCHGLSIRLTGGAQTSNCLSGHQQAGEGWSDLCALFFTADASHTRATSRGVGNYAVFEPETGPGIRSYPYSTDMSVNPLTYQDVPGATAPHGVGTIFATVVWEMYWNFVDKYTFDTDLYTGNGGNNIAIQLVVDGLKMQPCNPSFLDARDAIIAADAAMNPVDSNDPNSAGENECLIWDAFAKRGMGFSAYDGGSASSTSIEEAFDLPAQCNTSYSTAPTTTAGSTAASTTNPATTVGSTSTVTTSTTTEATTTAASTTTPVTTTVMATTTTSCTSFHVSNCPDNCIRAKGSCQDP